jgi:hypothetical protein
LTINFHKSTVTPMNLLEGAFCKASWVSFNVRRAHSPRHTSVSYYPMSNCHCRPSPPSSRRLTSTWQALLLSTAGRVVLINSILVGIPTYAIGAMLLPPGVVAAIDARRRAFLWTCSNRASGAQCLVAWDNVYVTPLVLW